MSKLQVTNPPQRTRPKGVHVEVSTHPYGTVTLVYIDGWPFGHVYECGHNPGWFWALDEIGNTCLFATESAALATLVHWLLTSQRPPRRLTDSYAKSEDGGTWFFAASQVAGASVWRDGDAWKYQIAHQEKVQTTATTREEAMALCKDALLAACELTPERKQELLEGKP